MKLYQRPRSDNTLQESYNQTPYLSQCHPASSLERLEFIATLFSLWPKKALSHRSILELGCGSGGNLIPMAWRNREDQFLGIDFSEEQIKAAHSLAQELKLTNITFECRDLQSLDIDSKYDVVIAHGIYSWISNEARCFLQKNLSSLLKEDGIAYINYDAMPGAAAKQVVRKILLSHLESDLSVSQLKSESIKILKYIAGSAVSHSQGLLHCIKEQLMIIEHLDPTHFVHDYLELYYSPYYFHDFSADMEQFALKHVADPYLSYFDGAGLRNDIKQSFHELTRHSPELNQHYIDFLTMRGFNTSILTHRDREISHSLSESNLPESVYILGLLQSVKGRTDTFWMRGSNEKIQIREELAQSVFQVLSEYFPLQLTIHEIIQHLPTKLKGQPELVKKITGLLLQGLTRRFVQIQMRPNSLLNEQEFVVNNLVRAYAKIQQKVPNAYHESVPCSEEELSALISEPAVISGNNLPNILKKFSDSALLYSAGSF